MGIEGISFGSNGCVWTWKTMWVSPPSIWQHSGELWWRRSESSPMEAVHWWLIIAGWSPLFSSSPPPHRGAETGRHKDLSASAPVWKDGTFCCRAARTAWQMEPTAASVLTPGFPKDSSSVEIIQGMKTEELSWRPSQTRRLFLTAPAGIHSAFLHMCQDQTGLLLTSFIRPMLSLWKGHFWKIRAFQTFWPGGCVRNRLHIQVKWSDLKTSAALCASLISYDHYSRAVGDAQ